MTQTASLCHVAGQGLLLRLTVPFSIMLTAVLFILQYGIVVDQ